MAPLQIIDDFLPDPDRMRASALRSGFGTWRPNKGDIGLESYAGMNFIGDHAQGARALHRVLGSVLPTTMFFRVTNPAGDHGVIHCDRWYAPYSAIAYLTPNAPEGSGTAFYRHRRTGWTDLPSLEDLVQRPDFRELTREMLAADQEAFEQIDFVPGRFNRCIVFPASRIHCRIPREGFGSDEKDSRMVWVCHFERPENG